MGGCSASTPSSSPSKSQKGKKKKKLNFGSNSGPASRLLCAELTTAGYTLSVTSKKLGVGSFAQVYMGKNKDDVNCAIKMIEKRKLTEGDLAQLQNECTLHKEVTPHKDIVSLIEVVDTPNVMYLVLEPMHGGEMFDRLAKVQRYAEEHAVQCARGLCGALAHMHARSILHRDMKPENVLYVNNEETAHVKVCDLGLAVRLEQ